MSSECHIGLPCVTLGLNHEIRVWADLYAAAGRVSQRLQEIIGGILHAALLLKLGGGRLLGRGPLCSYNPTLADSATAKRHY